MAKTWNARYLDGRSAARHRATVQPLASGLEIAMEQGTGVLWPYDQIRLTQGTYAGEHIRLEHGSDCPEVIVVADHAFLTELRRRAPTLASHVHDPAHRGLRVKLTVVAGVAAIGIAGALYLWGIPALAMVVAPHVPVAWEERLGQEVVETLVPEQERCAEPYRLRMINQIAETLIATAPGNPYTFRVYVVNHPMVNAFAAPGGLIVVFRGLLEQTKTPEELAGVLAHEVQHVLQRHVSRAILEEASTGVLLAAVSGDLSGAMTYGLQAASTIGSLKYSRGHEKEADTKGFQMLAAAGVNPQGMVSFFKTMKEKHPDVPDLFKYLSTHPQTDDRIAYLEALVATAPAGSTPLLPGLEWSYVRSLCQAKKTESHRR